MKAERVLRETPSPLPSNADDPHSAVTFPGWFLARQTPRRSLSDTLRSNESQKEGITAYRRAVLVDWMLQAQAFFGLPSAAVHRAVCALDRLLLWFAPDLARFQLIGYAMLVWIASNRCICHCQAHHDEFLGACRATAAEFDDCCRFFGTPL